MASGAFSNLYRGSYCGQEVAVKILKDVQDDTSQYQEFLQVWWRGEQAARAWRGVLGLASDLGRAKHLHGGDSRDPHGVMDIWMLLSSHTMRNTPHCDHRR